MPNPLVAGIGASVGGAVVQSNAAGSAAKAQTQAAAQGTALQREMFETAQGNLKPYVDAGIAAISGLEPYQQAGVSALQQQLALVGLSGDEAQRSAISSLEGSPQFEALTRTGEEAILQQAAATGGLRGGQTQSALAQFRPEVLSTLIDKQYGRLGGLTNLGVTTTQNVAQLGQAAGAGQAAAGTNAAANMAATLQQAGAAQAGGALARGQAFGDVFGSAGTLFGTIAGDGAGIPQGQTMFSRWGF